MKLIEMAKHHSHEQYLINLINLVNDKNHLAKIVEDGEERIVKSAEYIDEQKANEIYGDEDMEPFVIITFADDEDAGGYLPSWFIEHVQIYELKRVK